MKRVLAVVVNYRTADLTIDCLGSLAAEADRMPGLRVVVTDNGSGDGSVTRIAHAIEQRGWDRWASVLPLETNGGFAVGNNAAIRPALESPNPPDYVLMLNSDTIIRASAIQTLVDFMERNPTAGIAGSRLEDLDGTPQHSRYRFPNLWNEFEGNLKFGPVTRLLKNQKVSLPIQDAAHAIGWVCGGSMLIRREVFDDVGLLDESFFLYFEETDFALHARRAGWSCWYVPGSRVVHLVGRSSGVTAREKPPERRPIYWFESRRRYFLKNHGALYAALIDLIAIVAFTLRLLRRAVQRKPNGEPPCYLRDLIRHSVFVCGFSIADDGRSSRNGFAKSLPAVAEAAPNRGGENETNSRTDHNETNCEVTR